MKKITLIAAMIAVTGWISQTNAQSFEEGDNVLNLTVGFGSTYYTAASSVSPGVAASLEHCFWDDLINGDFSIGIGGYLGLNFTSYGPYDYVGIIPAARGTFHWTGVENLDTYTGLSTGARIIAGDDPGTPGYVGPGNGGFHVDGFVGARWYFSDSFCAAAEIGSGISVLNLGVGFKF